jgi:hypothetical protein
MTLLESVILIAHVSKGTTAHSQFGFPFLKKTISWSGLDSNLVSR